MKIGFLLPVGALLITVLPSPGQDAKSPGSRNYLVFPITTKLQRSVLYTEKTAFKVLINGNAVVQKGGIVKGGALDLEDLRRALGNRVLLMGEDTITITIFYSRFVKRKAHQFVYWALHGVGSSRFRKVSVGSSISDEGHWQKALAAIKRFGPPDDDKVQEDPVEAAGVKVFPVRTALSRLVLDDADCLVVITAPLDARSSGDLSPAQQKAIRNGVYKLDLPNRSRLSFHIGVKRDGRKAAKFFFDVAAKYMTKRLGFKTYSVTNVEVSD